MNQHVAILGGGCFWCLEAVFEHLQGVTAVESGYCGGHVLNPSYEQVCDGDTGHVEVVRVQFDAEKLPFRELLALFFSIHDPTTPGRQGNDVGPQYRSAIFYADDGQRLDAEQVMADLKREKVFSRAIVTELLPVKNYFTAEPEHQRYFDKHPNQGYCSIVIAPKVSKFRKQYAARLK
jgi:peptide-methionine (S)-S-oxide reductase